MATASARLREVADSLQHRLVELQKSCASMVQATSTVNADHLASAASAGSVVDHEQEVALQGANPKTGLAGGGRKGSKKERKAKCRKKRAAAAEGRLCAHRWCDQLCVNWAAGHILCNLCDKLRQAALEDYPSDWRDEPNDQGYHQTWFDYQVLQRDLRRLGPRGVAPGS